MIRSFAVFICAAIIAGLFFSNSAFADDVLEDEPFTETISNGVVTYEDGKVPVIDAASAIVMDTESGRVLFEKNAYQKRPIASTTKIATAIVALEEGNLEDIVTVSRRAAGMRGSTIGLKLGQKLKLIDLLYGLMLNSGNDAAVAIAEHIGGSVEGFVEMMNRKAAQIGAQNTCFKSPHGLDIEGHYSTAYDIAIITRYAMKNPVFSEIVQTKVKSIPGRNLHNTNEMLGAYPGADGVKTGYTGKAGRCLVTSATRDGWRLVSVVLGCASRYKRAQSSKVILDYAFSNYKLYALLKQGDSIGRTAVYKGVKEYVDITAAEGIQVPLRPKEAVLLERQVLLPKSIDAPIYAGIDTGTVRFLLNNEVIAEVKLKTRTDIKRKGFMDYVVHVFNAWIMIVREGIFF